MNHPSNPDDDLTAALQRLPRELDPPAHVRSNLRANLREHSRSNHRANLWRLAVAASLIALWVRGRPHHRAWRRGVAG